MKVDSKVVRMSHTVAHKLPTVLFTRSLSFRAPAKRKIPGVCYEIGLISTAATLQLSSLVGLFGTSCSLVYHVFNEKYVCTLWTLKFVSTH